MRRKCLISTEKRWSLDEKTLRTSQGMCEEGLGTGGNQRVQPLKENLKNNFMESTLDSELRLLHNIYLDRLTGRRESEGVDSSVCVGVGGGGGVV